MMMGGRVLIIRFDNIMITLVSGLCRLCLVSFYMYLYDSGTS